MKLTRLPVRGAAVAAVAALLTMAACSSDGPSSPATATDPTTSTIVTTTAPASTTTLRPSSSSAPTTTLPAGTVTFTMADGLPADEVLAVDVNEDGTTWAVIQRDDVEISLARLDGDRWIPFDPPAPFFGIPDLAAGPDGTAWMISSGFAGPSGLWEFDGESWIVHTDCSEQGVADGNCQRSVTEAQSGAVGGDGDLWATGFFSDGEVVDCGFLRREGDDWVSFSPNPVPLEGGFAGFCPREDDFGPDGHPYVLTDDGLFRLDDDGWTELSDRNAGPQPEGRNLAAWAVGENSVVWAIRFDLPAVEIAWDRFDGERWSTLPIGVEGIANVDIDQECVLAEDPGRHPAQLEAQLRDPIERANLLFGLLRPLAVDASGGAWTAIACSGVQRLDPADGSVTVDLTTANGLPSLRFTDLEVGPDGAVWIATLDGLTRVVP